jgi:hypothetical protein
VKQVQGQGNVEELKTLKRQQEREMSVYKVNVRNWDGDARDIKMSDNQDIYTLVHFGNSNDEG